MKNCIVHIFFCAIKEWHSKFLTQSIVRNTFSVVAQ